MECKKQFLIILVSCLIGYISWYGNLLSLAFAPLIIIPWSRAEGKWQAYLCILAYYLSASHGLIKGAGVFFGNPQNQEVSIANGLAIWLIPNLILSIPWALLWSNNGYWWRSPLILFLISIPPLGLFGWANPITAAGAWFPGTEWFGLAAIIMTMVILCYKQSKIIIAALSFLVTICLITNILHKEPPAPKGWIGVSTSLGWIKNSYDEYSHHKQLIEIVSSIIYHNDHINVILLPELVTGNWNEANKNLWNSLNNKAKQHGITILIGGKQWLNKKEYINGLIAIGKEQNKLLLSRVPVPISMWHPWSKTKPSAKSYWFNPGIYEITGKIVTTVICYEQLLIWPVLNSMMYKPDIFLSSSNVWWAKDTNISAIQRQGVMSWSRLFKIPLLKAIND